MKKIILGMMIMILGLLLFTSCGTQTNSTKESLITATPFTVSDDYVESEPPVGMIFGFVPSSEGTYVQVEGIKETQLNGMSDVEVPETFLRLPVRALSINKTASYSLNIPKTIEGMSKGFPFFVWGEVKLEGVKDNPYFEIKNDMLFTKGLGELLAILGPEGEYVIPKETTKIGRMEKMLDQNFKFTVEEGNPVFYCKDGLLYEKKNSEDVCLQGADGEYYDYYNAYDLYMSEVNEVSPADKRSPYEGFSIEIVNNDNNKNSLQDILDFTKTKQYAIITDYKGREQTITLPEKVGKYPVLCGNIYSDYCTELVIPERFCGFYQKELATVGDDEEKEVWSISVPLLPKLSKLTIDKNNKLFVVKNDILFSKDMKRLYFGCATRTGKYTIPESVIDVESYAFSYSKMDEVTFGKNVKEIGSFFMYNSSIKKIIFNNSKISDSEISSKLTGSLVTIDKVEKKGNQRIYHVKYDPQAYGVTE